MSIVYFKFRSQLAYETVMFDGHFVSVGELKRLIAQKKSMGADAVAELVLTDPRTNTEYADDNAQISKGSHVIIRRVPANKSRVLVGATPLPQVPKPAATKQPAAPSAAGVSAAVVSSGAAAGIAAGPGPSSAAEIATEDFGADPFAQSAAALQQEESVMRMLHAAADNAHRHELASAGRGGRGGFGGGRGRGRNRPDPNYLCKRCGQTGHWLSDCPTKDDPNYDYKPVRMPAGIPVTKLQRNADGSLVLPTGEFGELAPNQRAFQQQLALMTGGAPPVEQPLALPGPADVAAATAPTSTAEAPASQQHPQQEVESLSRQEATAAPAAAAASPEEPAEREPDLFDDEDGVPTEPIKLSLASEGAASKGRSVSPDRLSDRTALKDSIPEELQQPFCTPAEFLEFLPMLVEVLPRASVKQYIKAYGSGQPLTRTEFSKLQREARQNGRSTATDRSEGRRRARSESASRSPSRGMDGKTERRSGQAHRAAHVSHGESPSVQRKARHSPSRSPVHAGSHGVRPADDLRFKLNFNKKARMQDQSAAAEGSYDSYERAEKPRTRMLEESSRIVDRDGEDHMETGNTRERKRNRAGSVEISLERAEEKDSHRRHSSQHDYENADDISRDTGSPRQSSDYGKDRGSVELADKDSHREGIDDSKKHKKKHRKSKKHKSKEKSNKKDKKRRSHHSSSPEPPAEALDQNRDDHDEEARHVERVASQSYGRMASRDEAELDTAVPKKRSAPGGQAFGGAGRVFQRALLSAGTLDDRPRRHAAAEQQPGDGRWTHDRYSGF
mmetsp:Transcript_29727/g.65769  ORF Transcript_29727/g.65769 Transcript_29727/m.65769 type:complete len:788 (-) Transcript_29727:698-3061(-)